MDKYCSFLLYIYCTLFAPKSGLSKCIVGVMLAYLDWIVLSYLQLYWNEDSIIFGGSWVRSVSD